MKTLLEVKDGQLIQSGIRPNQPANQQTLWRDGMNVLFLDNSAEKAKGLLLMAAVGTPVTGLSQAFVAGQRRVYFATATAFYRHANDLTESLRSTFTGGRWSILPWGTWVLATNGVQPVQVDKNTGHMVDLAGVPVATARIIRKLANRPIIFYGQEAAWPNAANIEDWVVAPETRAGSYFIRDLDSDVVAVEPFGEQLAFYTRNKMGFVQFIGGSAVYGFKLRMEGIGAVGINAVIPVGVRHYGLSVDGAWRTDGSGFDYIDTPEINRTVSALLDKTRGDEVVGIHVKDRSMVAWFFPSTDGSIHGLGYNYSVQSWQHMQMPITAGAPQEVFDQPLAGTSVGNWGMFDTGNDVATVTMPSSLTSGAFDAGAPGNFKWWDRVGVSIEQSGEVEVRFGLHKQEVFGRDADDVWLAWTPLERDNWIQRESVYLTMELRSTAADVSWRLGGLKVEGELAGAV